VQKPNQSAKPTIPIDNTLRLSLDMQEALYVRYSRFLQNTPQQKMRRTDILAFVQITRGNDTIAKLCRELMVSRQASHMSVQRLCKSGMIDFQAVPGNGRDKQAVLTALGRDMLKSGSKEISEAEAEMSKFLGAANMKKFRENVIKLRDFLQIQNGRDLARPRRQPLRK
jgi:DNA-binding MarR family transcriptional regulator